MDQDTTPSVGPLRIGPFGVLAFHHFQPGEAARVHVECRRTPVLLWEAEAKKQQEEHPRKKEVSSASSATGAVREAVVMDHRYVFSFSQLCTALHRCLVQRGPTASRGGERESGLGVDVSPSSYLHVCKAFACSHNTELLMHQLPPGPTSTAVAIIWYSPEQPGPPTQLSASPSAVGSVGACATAPTDGHTVGAKRTRPVSASWHLPSLDGSSENHFLLQRFFIEAEAIYQAVRRASPTAVAHSLIATPPPPPSPLRFSSLLFGGTKRVGAGGVSLSSTSPALPLEEAAQADTSRLSHPVYYTSYADWSSILSFYRVVETELLPMVLSVPSVDLEVPSSTTPPPPSRCSSPSRVSSQKRGTSSSLVSNSPSDVLWWDALARVVVTKLATYNV